MASAPPTHSRPESHVFPVFHSSLEYALVRDFAYAPDNLMHYGPPPDPPSGATSPASEFGRRMSDPVIQWSNTNMGEDDDSYFQLPKRTFGDSPEDARLGYTSGHKRGRSNVVDYDSTRYSGDGRGGAEANRILYPDTNMDYYESTPELQNTDSPSQSPSEAYDDEDMDAMGSQDDGWRGKALTLFDFHRENDNELPFVEGQVLWINYKHGEGWLVAQDPRSGESGLIPEEYVRMVRDIEGGLSGLKGEGFELDSPEGVENDTPTETNGNHSNRLSERHGSGSRSSALTTSNNLLDTKAVDTSDQGTPTSSSHPRFDG